MSASLVASVQYEDEIYEFVEGDLRRFGRDDEAVDIPIWTAIQGINLSRVAGELWLRDGEMWVRNLSTAHELALLVPGQPPMEHLAARVPNSRGYARSLPAPEAWVCGPDGLRLCIRQELPAGSVYARAPRPGGAPDTGTRHATPVPAELMGVAVALCEPLLRGGPMPANYREIAERIAKSYKGAILQVDKLLDLYRVDLPALAQHEDERRRRTEPQEVHGRWVLPDPTALGAIRSKVVELPRYEELARFLVRRRLVTLPDVDGLAD